MRGCCKNGCRYLRRRRIKASPPRPSRAVVEGSGTAVMVKPLRTGLLSVPETAKTRLPVPSRDDESNGSEGSARGASRSGDGGISGIFPVKRPERHIVVSIGTDARAGESQGDRSSVLEEEVIEEGCVGPAAGECKEPLITGVLDPNVSGRGRMSGIVIRLTEESRFHASQRSEIDCQKSGIG